MSLKEMYEYTYYKVYKSMALATEWGADWRAGGLFLILQALIPWSVITYFEIGFPYIHPISFFWFIIPIVFIYLLDYNFIISRNKWKEIVKKYDAWPKKKNFRGTLIVWGILAIVIANFIIACNLYAKVYLT